MNAPITVDNAGRPTAQPPLDRGIRLVTDPALIRDDGPGAPGQQGTPHFPNHELAAVAKGIDVAAACLDDIRPGNVWLHASTIKAQWERCAGRSVYLSADRLAWLALQRGFYVAVDRAGALRIAVDAECVRVRDGVASQEHCAATACARDKLRQQHPQAFAEPAKKKRRSN